LFPYFAYNYFDTNTRKYAWTELLNSVTVTHLHQIKAALCGGPLVNMLDN